MMDVYKVWETTKRIGFLVSIIGSIVSWVQISKGGIWIDYLVFFVSVILMFWFYEPGTAKNEKE